MTTVAAAALLALGACSDDAENETTETTAEETTEAEGSGDAQACEVVEAAYSEEQEALEATEGSDDEKLATDLNTKRAALKQAIQDGMIAAEDQDLKDQLSELYSNPLPIVEEDPEFDVDGYYASIDSVLETCQSLN